MDEKGLRDNLLNFKMREEHEEEAHAKKVVNQLQPEQVNPLHQGQPQLDQQQIKIRAQDLPNLACTCGNEVFEECVQVKKIPSVISNTGKDELQAIPAILCRKCGKDLSDIMEELKKLDK